ncbi:MAG: 1-deoxy-D-xylulose-5-phosphate reductoisomerase [Gammaproteobacteria bacterium]|nr:MAG: 1-deoxy-D-xylulose-5-phosphate reductoisomerase [Gammaproteobacteria bacterium]UCH39589.1 MAG: 1-deoxy-D-xylulose-5-phosphate reductoisomerase [Gammaproteobacteria bacterium]
MKQVTILGATGSIGQSTLDIISRHRDRYAVYALTANSNVDKMQRLCRQFEPGFVVMSDAARAEELSRVIADLPTEVLAGEAALAEVAAADQADIVVAAIVGAAGLMPTLSAVRSGKRVLLANKESLVMAGALFMDEVRQHGAELLPVDSEHNAIFQCLPPGGVGREAFESGVQRIILTGSGGPFRDIDINELDNVTPEQACAHPNWDMGPKISVDSATMMNKGLEMIEACWLFAVDEANIEIVLHRQSIVHSMVSYLDGSVIAQLGNPDMRTPIANALSWPERIDSGVEPLNLLQVSQLDFTLADEARYPCLSLAREAWHRGGTCMAVLNAVNEIAVEQFLQRSIRFMDIPKLIENVLRRSSTGPADQLDTVLQADADARELALDLVNAGDV